MPNLEAVKAKVAVTGDLGETYDQMLEAAEREAYGREGAEKILQAASKLVLKLHEHVDKDHEAGEIPKGELQIVGYTKKYVTRASECLLNLAKKMEAEKYVAHGKVAALKPAVALVQRHHDSANAVAKQLEAALEEARGESKPAADQRSTLRGVSRQTGQHPGPSPLEKRRAEGKRLKAERQAREEAAQSPSTDAPDPPANGKKKRSRKRAKPAQKADG